ncbi:TetR/AcrR family transcriptional regulator C-terminal domain-containing protein [Wohlfahrtiimonas larvae]|uniref:TetR/AcrR family transcriptional regulator n=1 Tax=Wohlfahrtiimonas larvae TaxID=1157986 RepID=A0ABP9MRR0_9GAMM|nr:TetR/AcrR family transcriptional regulator C-terminal domain-containing protein [Wohlfahrtiimonas larvae]
MEIKRETIINKALELLNLEGIEGLSMRKLATALNMQAPSLYWYFANKQALIDGLADSMIERVAINIDSKSSWQTQIRQIAGELRDALSSHRDGARVFAGTYIVSDNVLRTNEALMQALLTAGVNQETAVDYSFTVIYYILGLVMEEQGLSPQNGINLISRQTAFSELAKDKYPINQQAQNTIFTENFTRRFKAGLDLIITGIEKYAETQVVNN